MVGLDDLKRSFPTYDSTNFSDTTLLTKQLVQQHSLLYRFLTAKSNGHIF